MHALLMTLLLSAAPASDAATAAPPPTMADVLAHSTGSDWRTPDPDDTLYLDLPQGRVVIELAPDFAPAHVGNLRTLAREGYFRDLRITRSQDNYVVQWGDPQAGSDAARPLGSAQAALPAEFDRSADGQPFTAAPDGDVYAPEAGWSAGFPVGRDPAAGRLWLAHCYGMLGAGRDMAADSSTGAELYVVTGHSPRHLDRNITLVGRVLRGMELLSSLPRGTGPLGFYADAAQRVPIKDVVLASSLPPERRERLQVLRTDTSTFARLVAARRHRHEDWFIQPVGRIELCNVPIPVREAPAP